MTKVRQDAWSHEDDLLLAETILRHIREGSTQLNAFEEVGDLLNRTSAACGFRWNAEVRQKYEQAVQIAKKQRKEKKRAEAKRIPEVTQTALPAVEPDQSDRQMPAYTKQAATPVVQSEASLSLKQVIAFLQDLSKEQRSYANVQLLEQENNQLKQEIEQLKQEKHVQGQQIQTIQEDYQVLIQIMDRARKMVIFDDQDSHEKPQFRMEKNGNLEHVAR
ncbi:RsfA family transcriptional regulator [Thalassobacillus sp. CUG 92003]|uniref:RsfA family transcriptional regulator n=1 Tax=Thalassobacillus sp. CUG 92003 TaxID=2736641 RepID=UPI0015E7262A|nr:RsfA family transcriptional regulator [Thalassobacillus sp. CUG 92003]